jgi:hypothetical protein
MTETQTMDAPTRNAALFAWVDEIASLCGRSRSSDATARRQERAAMRPFEIPIRLR